MLCLFVVGPELSLVYLLSAIMSHNYVPGHEHTSQMEAIMT